MKQDAPTRRLIPRRALLLEMVRFGVMGLTSAGIYLVFLIPLKWAMPSRLWLAAALAYLLCMAINYVLQRNFTFKSERPHQEAVVRFIVVQSVGLALNAAVLEYAATYAKLPMWLAISVAVFCVAVWSYLAQKVWVFVGKHHGPAGSPDS